MLDLGPRRAEQLDYRRVQLLDRFSSASSGLWGRWRCATQGADEGVGFAHDERALERAGDLAAIDEEVRGDVHGADDVLGDVAEGAIEEDGRVERGVEVVGGRHHFAQVVPDEVRVVPNGLRDGAEDDAGVRESLFVSGGEGIPVRLIRGTPVQFS